MPGTINWASVDVNPKRRFRYGFRIGGISEYYVKTATMPKANVSTIEHSYLDYTFKFPGRVTWDPISITLVAPAAGAGDPSDLLWAILQEAGWTNPRQLGNAAAYASLSKKGFSNALGAAGAGGGVYDPELILYDERGGEAEKWTLSNAFITNIDWGGSLDYTSDEMLELTVEVTFDWAEKVK
jgi:hypothetical protein